MIDPFCVVEGLLLLRPVFAGFLIVRPPRRPLSARRSPSANWDSGTSQCRQGYDAGVDLEEAVWVELLGPALLAEVDRVRAGLSRRGWLRELAASGVLAADAFAGAGRGGLGERLVADPSRVSSTGLARRLGGRPG